MANYCFKCGQPVGPDDVFCVKCGARLSDSAAPAEGITQPVYQAPQNYSPVMSQAPVYAGNGAVREGIPQPGFSDRVNHPEILAAVNRTRRMSVISAFFIVPIPLVGLFLYASFTGKMEIGEAVRNGGIISLVFLVFAVWSFLKSRPKHGYDAVVTSKYTRERADRSSDDDDATRTDYITVVQTTDGKTKKITETDHSRIWAYDHLKVGDRFRYHPQFAFPYELYDKSKADALYCPACGAANPVTADRCKRCRVPLLK